MANYKQPVVYRSFRFQPGIHPGRLKATDIKFLESLDKGFIVPVYADHLNDWAFKVYKNKHGHSIVILEHCRDEVKFQYSLAPIQLSPFCKDPTEFSLYNYMLTGGKWNGQIITFESLKKYKDKLTFKLPKECHPEILKRIKIALGI